MRLGKSVGADRLEAAATRALAYRLTSFRAIRDILRNGHDKLPLHPPAVPALPPHENIRGGAYYSSPLSEEAPIAA